MESYSRKEIEGYEKLEALALNVLWAWNHHGDKVWQDSIPSYGRSPKIPG